MESFLNIFILIPVAGFLLSLLIPGKREGLLSGIAFGTVGLHLFSLIVFVCYWLYNGHASLDLKDLILFKNTDYEFFVDFCFDKITAVYILVGAFLTFM